MPELPVYGFCHNTDLRQLQKNVLKQEYIKAQIAKLNRIFALHEEQKTQICQMFHVTAEQVEVSGMGYNSHIFRDLHIRKVRRKDEDCVCWENLREERRRESDPKSCLSSV